MPQAKKTKAPESVIHEIDIMRIGYGTKTVKIEGGTREEAVEKALDGAGNHEYSEHNSEYSVFGETTDKGIPILSKPLSKEVMKAAVKAGEFVKGVIRVPLSGIIGKTLEDFLDMLGNKLTASDLLMEINYSVVGAESDGTLLIEVSGNAESVVDFEGDGE